MRDPAVSSTSVSLTRMLFDDTSKNGPWWGKVYKKGRGAGKIRPTSGVDGRKGARVARASQSWPTA
jgi:hypothetical protein